MFAFALEALLRHRRAIEEAAHARYAAAAREERNGKRARGRLEAVLLETCAGRTLARDLAEIERADRTQAVRVERARAACRRLREAAIAAARDRRALELLRQRQLAAYRRERLRREERDLEDSNRFASP